MYGISNYDRVINYESGKFLKIIQNNNKIFVSEMLYDNRQKLWNKVHGTSDYIDVNKSCKATHEMNYTIQKEFYRGMYIHPSIPGFPGYRVSNYANIKEDETDRYMTSQKNGRYYQLELNNNSEPYKKSVHQIVALAFHGRQPSEEYTVEP